MKITEKKNLKEPYNRDHPYRILINWRFWIGKNKYIIKYNT